MWGVLLYAPPAQRYYLPAYGAASYVAALVLLAALTAAFSLARSAWVRAGRPLPGLFHAAVALALLSPLDYTREALGVTRFELLHRAATLPTALQVAGAALAAAALWLALRQRRRGAGAVFALLLLLSPLALSNAAQCAWRALRAPGWVAADLAIPARPGAAGATAARAAPGRVVWIVFDELDYRLAFEDRPADLALPALDRLRAESFFASAAQEPSDHTGTSIPAFLLGRPVAWATPTAPGVLSFRFEGEPPEVVRSLAEADTFFSALAAAGRRVGVVGIYHPYCRLFGDRLARCHWEPFLPGGGVRLPDSFAGALGGEAYKLLPLVHYRGEHVASIRRSLAAAAALASDPSLDAVYVHLPIPHSPHVWDARRGRFTLLRVGRGGYLDQLALADRALGDLRAALERAGTWDASAVLVTSDHGWRFAAANGYARDHRVPFLLKPARAATAGPERGLGYAAPFPAWRARELLELAAGGSLTSVDAVASRLDARDFLVGVGSEAR